MDSTAQSSRLMGINLGIIDSSLCAQIIQFILYTNKNRGSRGRHPRLPPYFIRVILGKSTSAYLFPYLYIGDHGAKHLKSCYED